MRLLHENLLKNMTTKIKGGKKMKSAHDVVNKEQQTEAIKWQNRGVVKGNPIIDYEARREYVKKNNPSPEELKDLTERFIIGWT